MSELVNTVVIGAGVIGLACARSLAQSGREVIVAEQHSAIGQETSSRNSEVIHAGIYYTPGSLKARLCVEGKKMLYDYCAARGVAHQRIGKLIVAPRASDRERLREISDRAARNGVDDLRWLTAPEVEELEPAVEATAAVLSPSTGIIDSHAFMLALQGDLESAGGMVALRSRLAGGQTCADGMRLKFVSEDVTTELVAQNVINCAGLHASIVARLLHDEARHIPQTRFARGNYFEYAAANPFRRLIYPLPAPGGLGIHATVDLSGSLRFGPDVEWISELDYAVDPQRAAAFAESIGYWWPAVDATQLKAAYAGIRPKLSQPDATPADFQIRRTDYGNARVVDLFGIESPGLTSTLAISEYVREVLNRN